MVKPGVKAVILINHGGGTAKRDPEIGPKVEAALRAAGVDGEVELLDGPGVAARAKEAVEAGAPLIIAGGGDGTISAAAGAIAGSETVLGVLPLGTLNHFARDLGVPFDLAGAAAVIGAGHERRVDAADLNGRVFINNSALGLYPLMVVDRDTQEKRLGRSKKFALVVAGIRTLARFKHQRLTLTVNETRGGSVETPLLFVGNNDYSLEMPAAGSRRALDEGRLCVMVLRKKGRLGRLAASLRALTGRMRGDDMVRLDNVQRLRVSSHRSVLAVAIDGETEHLKPPLDYRIRAGALRVLAPSSMSNSAG
ncbi:diacylglycerol kinase family protein [Sphingomonas sp.]|uniref:diacylglycerol/lipid kinase family protein n=1 Tax=Sphingomonas sp. TaxID=28214 RepID=UPI00260150F2|nr:diacylglycerol kinase family protein [Sphingomonas sp.]